MRKITVIVLIFCGFVSAEEKQVTIKVAEQTITGTVTLPDIQPTPTPIPLPAQAKHEVPIYGTGDPNRDDLAMARAVAELNSRDRGTLVVHGTLSLKGDYFFAKPISIRGAIGTDPTIQHVDQGGMLAWNRWWEPFREPATKIQNTIELASEIIVPKGTLAPGDFFLVASDDEIRDLTRHTSKWSQGAMEIHQAKEIRHSQNSMDWIVFDDIIADPLQKNPRVWKLNNVLQDISVRDLSFAWTGSGEPGYRALSFRKCANVTVQNCHWKYGGPDEMMFHYCFNVLVTNCILDHRIGYGSADGYCVIAGVVNNFLFSDSIAHGCRHVFTTTGSSHNNIRYGTPRKVVLDNVVASMNGSKEPLVLFDTHAEGWGIVFQNCRVVVPYDLRRMYANGSTIRNNNVAFQTRSRKTTFRNCTAQGGIYGQACNIYGRNARVESCSFSDFWRGVVVNVLRNERNPEAVSGATVVNNVFENIDRQAVFLQTGSNHIVAGNVLRNSGRVGGVIAIYPQVTNSRIENNLLDKQINKHSVTGQGPLDSSVTFTGNNLRGYGSRNTGFDTNTLGLRDTNTAILPYNWVDQ